VAISSLRFIETKKPILVEDSGLFIESYYGFPGPYSHYVLDTLKLQGVLKLMEGNEKRSASFRSVIAYKDETGIHMFKGIVKGRIAYGIKGSKGFGYDPIFIPDEVNGDQTFGELPNKIKNTLSHRARSFQALGAWLTESE
jgi:XTP/dITP diphosphohydrolase